MVLTELIRQQFLESIIMMAGGAALGALYTLHSYVKAKIAKQEGRAAGAAQDTLREKAKRRRLLEGAAEIAFFVFAAFFITEYLRYASSGALHFHNFLAMGAGALLWRKLFCDKI